MTWAMVCGGEQAAYQACFPPPAATERSQLMSCMDFPLASSLQFQSSLSESRRAVRQRWPHFCRGRPPDCASGLCFVEGELSGVAPGHRPSAHNVGQHMHARTHAQAVLGVQAAQLGRQNICDAVPARTGREQRQVAPAPVGAGWHGHRPRLAHGWGGCALAYCSLKLGMPGADKNTNYAKPLGKQPKSTSYV